jgi:acetylornithine deacetylase/succinyl-diaminopimelate desuccinylase-like protein
VCVPAHTDVVPVGEGWDTDPFEPVIKDGCMYGRGTTDDKGPLASTLLLAAFLKQHEDEFTGTFLAGAVADEEVGSALGLVYLLAEGLIEADYAIVPDTGESVFRASCGEKGLYHLNVTFTGEQAHGSTPHRGLNAIWAAVAFLERVRALFGAECGFFAEDSHELFTPSTVNVATVSAGSAHNIIPGQCTIGLDIRYRPEKSREELRALLEDLAGQVQAEGLCLGFEVSEVTHMPPFELEADSPLVQAIRSATQSVTGKDVELFGMGGTTVCKQFVEHGIPAIGFSQQAHHQAHMANEHLDLDEIGLFGRVLGMAVVGLCEEGRGD